MRIKLKQLIKEESINTESIEQFDNDIDKYYDVIISMSKEEIYSSGLIDVACFILTHVPSKANLLKIQRWFEKSTVDNDIRNSIIETINKILNKQYKNEFRYSYGNKGKYGRRVSTTSELFSLLRQAITYNIDKDELEEYCNNKKSKKGLQTEMSGVGGMAGFNAPSGNIQRRNNASSITENKKMLKLKNIIKEDMPTLSSRMQPISLQKQLIKLLEALDYRGVDISIKKSLYQYGLVYNEIFEEAIKCMPEWKLFAWMPIPKEGIDEEINKLIESNDDVLLKYSIDMNSSYAEKIDFLNDYLGLYTADNYDLDEQDVINYLTTKINSIQKNKKHRTGYEVTLYWDGLTYDAGRIIGTFVLSDSTISKIERFFGKEISMDLWRDSTEPPMSYKNVFNAIKNSQYGNLFFKEKSSSKRNNITESKKYLNQFIRENIQDMNSIDDEEEMSIDENIIPPKFITISIPDDLYYWDEELIKKAKQLIGLKSINQTYFYDENQTTNLAELAPSYYLYPLRAYVEYDGNSFNDLTEEQQRIIEEIEYESMIGNEGVYMHCSDIDNYPLKKVVQEYTMEEWKNAIAYHNGDVEKAYESAVREIEDYLLGSPIY